MVSPVIMLQPSQYKSERSIKVSIVHQIYSKNLHEKHYQLYIGLKQSEVWENTYFKQMNASFNNNQINILTLLFHISPLIITLFDEAEVKKNNKQIGTVYC